MKSYTDLEQSKKLAEFLPLKSADMYYSNHSFENGYRPIPHIGDYSIIYNQLPCWSLAALSNFILPSIMDDNGNVYKFYLSKDGLNRWIAYYKSDNVSIHICEESYNMIDVIFEMVCYIFKNED